MRKILLPDQNVFCQTQQQTVSTDVTANYEERDIAISDYFSENLTFPQNILLSPLQKGQQSNFWIPDYILQFPANWKENIWIVRVKKKIDEGINKLSSVVYQILNTLCYSIIKISYDIARYMYIQITAGGILRLREFTQFL